MRIRNRFFRFCFWGMVLFGSILAGGIWFAYTYVTDGETAKRMIRMHAKRFLPGSTLEIGAVEIKPFVGEITMRRLTLNQSIDGAPFPTIHIPWFQIKLDTKKVLHGEFEDSAREIYVTQPTLQLCRRKDGTWNLQGLLASPWPGPAIKDPPPIIIKNGTVELLIPDEKDPAGEAKKVAVLREVYLKVQSAGNESTALEFEGKAKGDMFENVDLEGTVDPITGKVALSGDLSRLTISEMLQERIPREALPAVLALGLKGGEVNLSVARVAYDPTAGAPDRLHYEASAHLRAGVWECKNLPFPVTELSADLTARDGALTIQHAEGRNGTTTLRGSGTVRMGPPESMPMDVRVDLFDLMLDDRLRARTPPQYDELWDVFKPRGRVNAFIHVSRKEGGPVGVGARVVCQDVSGIYRHFPYPIEHMTGEMTMEGRRITVDLKTLVGSKPASLKGTIDEPGPDAVVRLGIEAESMPVDQALLDALPPDVRKVVNQFQPSGSAKASAKIVRTPSVGPIRKPEGDIRFDAVIDLKERCSIKWAGLPYPVRNLTGRLTIHPDLWEFEKMRGDNGQSLIAVQGRVRKLPLPKLENGEEPLKVELALSARNLLLNDELRDSLQPGWRKAWDTINPTGATDIDGWVVVEAHKPDSVLLKIRPRPKSNIRLVVPTMDPNYRPELPMEDIHGLFVFRNDVVSMQGVGFEFRGAPVAFDKGTVYVRDNGEFKLSVGSLMVNKIRFDSGFRRIMPRMMDAFAKKLDDGKTFTAVGDLEIGWKGVPGEPAWCAWQNTKVFFIDNALKAGIPLEHIQGQFERVSGWSDGKTLKVAGAMNLESVHVLGQQITQLKSTFAVDSRMARMDDIQGALLGGRLSGSCSVRLDSPEAPPYEARLLLEQAGLEQYGLTVPGRQSYRGRLDAGIAIQGQGNNIRTLRGDGWANVTKGDLGELPFLFLIAKKLNESLIARRSGSSPRTAFDEAEVKFRIHDGLTTLSPIRFTGNAVRLNGEGTLDPQGNLDISLGVLYGPGNFRIPVLSDALNEVSKEIVRVRIRGTASNPDVKIDPLPDLLRPLGRDRDGPASRRTPSERTLIR